MANDDDHVPAREFAFIEVVFVVAIVVVAVILTYPAFLPRCTTPARKSSCMSNLKELAVSLQMYKNDYDDMLPSSVLRQTKKDGKWDPVKSAEFCCERGPVPPSGKPEDTRWVQLLWPHMKNKDVIWCPSDHNKTSLPGRDRAMVSYIWKPAVDRAWFGGAAMKPSRKLDYDSYKYSHEFKYVSDQVVFFERDDLHWKHGRRGWRDGVTLNAAYLDGHISTITLKNAAACDAPRNSSELVRLLSRGGEPVWFNYNTSNNTTGEDVWYNPRIHYDELP